MNIERSFCVRSLSWLAGVFLVSIVIAFFAIRAMTDIDNILSANTIPVDEFNYRYKEHFALAFAHILPGIIYLVLAPFQFVRSIREKAPQAHRLIGRSAVACGLVSSLFGILFGLFFPFSGDAEITAVIVHGTLFVRSLGAAVFFIRQGGVDRHRVWIIRAFTIGTGVATIRIFIGLPEAFGLAPFETVFGLAFWIGSSINLVVAELYLSRSNSGPA